MRFYCIVVQGIRKISCSKVISYKVTLRTLYILTTSMYMLGHISIIRMASWNSIDAVIYINIEW